MEKNKDDPRCIRLDADVSNIASSLAKERRLSSVLSELLRKEFGVSFEEDVLQSELNEIERQQKEIEDRKENLEHLLKLKKRKEYVHSRINELESELSLLTYQCKKEAEAVIKIPIEDLEFDREGLADHQLMVQVSKARQKMREAIAEKFTQRDNSITAELLDLYTERENLS